MNKLISTFKGIQSIKYMELLSSFFNGNINEFKDYITIDFYNIDVYDPIELARNPECLSSEVMCHFVKTYSSEIPKRDIINFMEYLRIKHDGIFYYSWKILLRCKTHYNQSIEHTAHLSYNDILKFHIAEFAKYDNR